MIGAEGEREKQEGKGHHMNLVPAGAARCRLARRGEGEIASFYYSLKRGKGKGKRGRKPCPPIRRMPRKREPFLRFSTPSKRVSVSREKKGKPKKSSHRV